MHAGEWDITLTLGLVLAAAMVGGLLGKLLKAPKVTAYLLVGVVLGPQVFEFIPHEHFESLEPLTHLAMALVLFNLGCTFSLQHMKQIVHRVLPISAGELTGTFLLVSVGLIVLGEGWAPAILLGALALATAPATTMLVLKETESSGRITEYTGALVALNNLASILAFEIFFLGIHFFQNKLDQPFSQIWELVTNVFGSLLLGFLAGLVVSYVCALIDPKRSLIMVLAILALTLGVCEILLLPYMLTFLAMGMIVANSSEVVDQIATDLDKLTELLCVVFFVVHGAHLQLDAFMTVGVVGFGYIVFRFLGKYLGAYLTAARQNEEPEVRNYLGCTLIAQAGAAITLSAIAVERDPELGYHLQTIILGSVVFFELVGPILIRYSVLQAGEVPLDHAIHHIAHDPWSEFKLMFGRLSLALLPARRTARTAADITVEEMLKKNVKGLPQTATFNEIVEFIERSHDNTYPVVNDKGSVIGIIRYHELSSTLFNPRLGALVRAADLATSVEDTVYPDDPVSRAWEMFRNGTDDCIPVIAREQPQKLLGVVRRWDILRVFIRGHRTAQKQAE